MYVDALMDRMILQRADHLQPGAIADVRQTRIAMPAKIALQNTAVRCAIEYRTPGLELANTIRCFFCV